MVLGVCDQAGICGWGIEPYSGCLSRYTRDEHGHVDLLHPAPPPNGCPCGIGQRLMGGTLRETAEGSVIEMRVDADSGTVGFTVDEQGQGRRHPPTHIGYPRRRELSGFPRGVALRPWAMLYLHVEDQVTLHGCLEMKGSAEWQS